MAENSTVPKNLQCPLCFDLFEKATLLACGHTFCKKCLVAYDKTQATSEFMSCPLCRKPTNMPKKERVGGLAPNVTVNALVDDLKKAQSATLGLQKMRVSSKEPEESLTVLEMIELPAGVRGMARLSDDAVVIGFGGSQPGAVAFSISGGKQQFLEPTVGPEEDSLKVLRMLELPAGVQGMARLSDDTVVIGYGCSKLGADAVSISGAKKQYLKENIGPVRDIAILSDGRPVVSHGKDVIRVYNNLGFPTDIQFYTEEKGKNFAYYNICVGRADEVYAANQINSIFIFQEGKETPYQVVPLGNQRAIQVGVTTTGMMIIWDQNKDIIQQNSISLYDRYGNKGDTITSSEKYEYLRAAVDSQDRVFVGQIFLPSGRFKLSIYKIEDQRFIVLKKFKEVQLVKPHKTWHSMVCLTPTLLALANMDKKLYFIKVPGM